MGDRFGRVPIGTSAATRKATKTALRTLLAVAEFAGQDWCVWPSLEALSQASNLSRPRLCEGIKELCELGILEHIGFAHRVKRYRFCSLQSEDVVPCSRNVSSAQLESKVPPSRNVSSVQPECKFRAAGTGTDQTRPDQINKPPLEAQQEIKGPSKRLSKDLSEAAKAVGTWACEKAGTLASAAQLGKIRKLMKLWVGTPQEGELRDGKFWAACLTRAMVWHNPDKGGICTALVSEAQKALQNLARQRKREVDENQTTSANLVHQSETERLWHLRQLAAAGDKAAIAELYPEEESDAA